MDENLGGDGGSLKAPLDPIGLTPGNITRRVYLNPIQAWFLSITLRAFEIIV